MSSREKVAVLEIERKKGNQYSARFKFDWRDFDIFATKLKLEQNDQLAFVKDHELDKGAIEHIKRHLKSGIYSRDKLEDIGRLIWKLLPHEIKTSLVYFDLYAFEISKINLLPVIIRTDFLEIPWELCTTQHDTILYHRGRSKEKNKWFSYNWYKKYLTSYEIIGSSDPAVKVKEKDKKKVLLIAKTCKELDSLEGDFANEYSNLLELKKILEKEHKTQIHLCEMPKTVKDMKHFSEALSRGNFDLILYLGPYKHKDKNDKREGIVVQNPTLDEPEYFDVRKDISVKGQSQPLIFLDSCNTTLNESEAEETTYDLSYSFANHFLLEGASAYIGTIQKIEVITATVFARNLLYFIFNRCFSLSRAMHDAKIKTIEYFEKKKKEIFCIECCSFSLYGQNNNILLSSFKYRRDRLTLVYPKLIGQYFSGFNKTIYQNSIPGIKLSKEDDFPNVIKKISNIATPFIADLPILEATKLISNYEGNEKNEIVIIGGLFRLKPETDDCSLYYSEDIRNCRYFFHAGFLSTVTIMALAYFLDTGYYDLFRHKSKQRKEEYENIYNNMLNCLKEGKIKVEPFLLAAKSKRDFDAFLREKNFTQIQSIPLYKYFKIMINTKYKEYIFSKNLSAEVLVAKKKDITRDDKLFRELFTQWRNWEKQMKDRFPEEQEIIFSFDEKDVETIINFTKFVNDKLDGFSNEIGRPLQIEDFVCISPWKNDEKEYKEKEKKCLISIDEYRNNREKKLNAELAQASKRLEQAKKDDNIPETLKTNVESIKQKIRNLKEECKKLKQRVSFSETIDNLESIEKEIAAKNRIKISHGKKI